MEHELVAESTTDTPEEIANALGTEVDPPAEGEAPIKTFKRTGDVVDDAGAPQAPVEPDPAAADPAAAAAAAAPVAGAEPRQTRGQRRVAQVTGAAAEAKAAREKAEAEAKTLRDENARLKQELEARPGGERPADGARPAASTSPAAATVTPDTVELAPAVKERLAAKRKAVGDEPVEPQQTDFPDYDEFLTKHKEFRAAQRTYDRKHAAIDAEESIERTSAAQRTNDAAVAASRRASEESTQFAGHAAKVKEVVGDWDRVMADGEQVRIPEAAFVPMNQAMLRSGELGPWMQYYLASHPEELRQMATLDPAGIWLAMGDIKVKAAAERDRRVAGRNGAGGNGNAVEHRPAAAGGGAPPRTRPRSSEAPPPIHAVGGSRNAGGGGGDETGEDEPYDEWKEKRNRKQFGTRH